MAYCNRCDRHFNSHGAWVQHVNDSSAHWMCWKCDSDFMSWNALLSHYVNSPYHSYCRHCEEDFDDDDELEEHMEDCHWWCRHCDQVFRNERGLKEHYRQSPAHHYCIDCDRHFMSDSHLRSHRNSKLHHPQDVGCPFRGCGMSFVSRSALVLHLESGGCASRVSKREIDHFVRQKDTHNIITDPSRMITGGVEVYKEYIATRGSWNGHAYECVLCHREFRQLDDLNKHLASPRHQSKSYRCPNISCGVHFSTLSGLCQHIESEKCGVFKFRAVRDTMDKVFDDMRRLSL